MKIVFETERMKYEHTGLYHYCLNLGQALLDQKPSSDELFFYHNHKAALIFGKDKHYILQHSYHKFLKPSWNGYDLYHANYQLSAYLPRKGKCKVILTVHDLNFIAEGKSPEKIQKYLKKVQRNLDRADAVVAISNFVKADLEKHCDLRGKEIQVIYNGSTIDQKKIHLATAESPIAEPFLFTIGTIARKKNFHVLSYLLIDNSYKLIIAGINQDEAYRQEILDTAKTLGVDDRVILAGPITETEKYTYLKHCKLFVFPSNAEGFGLPVIEAMSFGKKVLLSRSTSLPEIGGSEAFYLENCTAEYLTKFTQEELPKIMAAADRSESIQAWAAQFTWEKAAEQYWTLYQKTLSK